MELRHQGDQTDLAGARRVGTTYQQTRTIPSRSEEGFEVTVFEPGKRLGVSGQIGPFHARISYHLEPTARGTRLTNDVSLEPSPGVMRLAARLAIPRVKAALAQNLGKLTEILETYSQDAGPSLALSWRDRAASGMI